MSAILQIAGLSKAFNGVRAVQNASFEVEEGEFVEHQGEIGGETGH